MDQQSTLADQWNSRYSQSEYFYGTEPNQFLKENFGSLSRGKVLCIADGEGRNSVFLAQQGFEVTSVDISHAGIEKTRRLADQRGVTVDAIVGDLTEFDLGENTWNGVVSIFSHLPSAIRQDLHRRIVDSLAPKGTVLLEAYTVDQIGRGTGGPQDPDYLMGKEMLRREFTGLEFVYLDERERNVVEGAGHTGMAAVVQMIARKK